MKYNDPDIEAAIRSELEKQLHAKVISSDFIPLGEESYGYKLATHDQTLFVKYSDDETFAENARRVSQLLFELKHFNFVVPPLLINGQTFFKVLRGNCWIFPHIEGDVMTIGNDKFGKELVSKLTKITALIHTETKNIKIDLPRETFDDVFHKQFELVSGQMNTSTTQKVVRELFVSGTNKIQQLIQKYTLSGNKYKSSSPPFVLSHGDISRFNIMRTTSGLKLIDWDGVMFAPKERDLNFLISNPHFNLDEYLKLTKQTKYDPILKEYYSQRWALETILGNFENLVTNGKSKSTREEYIEEIKEYLNH